MRSVGSPSCGLIWHSHSSLIDTVILSSDTFLISSGELSLGELSLGELSLGELAQGEFFVYKEIPTKDEAAKMTWNYDNVTISSLVQDFCFKYCLFMAYLMITDSINFIQSSPWSSKCGSVLSVDMVQGCQ